MSRSTIFAMLSFDDKSIKVYLRILSLALIASGLLMFQNLDLQNVGQCCLLMSLKTVPFAFALFLTALWIRTRQIFTLKNRLSQEHEHCHKQLESLKLLQKRIKKNFPAFIFQTFFSEGAFPKLHNRDDSLLLVCFEC